MAETQKARLQRALRALKTAREALGDSYYVGSGTTGSVDDAIKDCLYALDREWG